MSELFIIIKYDSVIEDFAKKGDIIELNEDYYTNLTKEKRIPHITSIAHVTSMTGKKLKKSCIIPYTEGAKILYGGKNVPTV